MVHYTFTFTSVVRKDDGAVTLASIRLSDRRHLPHLPSVSLPKPLGLIAGVNNRYLQNLLSQKCCHFVGIINVAMSDGGIVWLKAT